MPPINGKRARGFQAAPIIWVQDHGVAYHVSGESVDQESSRWLDKSNTSSQHSSLPGSPVSTNLATLGISFPSVSNKKSTIQETNVNESDATLIVSVSTFHDLHEILKITRTKRAQELAIIVRPVRPMSRSIRRHGQAMDSLNYLGR